MGTLVHCIQCYIISEYEIKGCRFEHCFIGLEQRISLSQVKRGTQLMSKIMRNENTQCVHCVSRMRAGHKLSREPVYSLCTAFV